MSENFRRRPPTYERTSIGDSVDIATMKLLKATYDTNVDKNIVSSPLGLMMLLSLYNEGAGPQAKSEITKFLGGIDSKQIADSFESLSVMFSEMNPDVLSVANKISVSDQYTLDENFAMKASGYRSEFDKIDFNKPEEAAAKINHWAAEKTKGHITNPVSKDALTSDTAAALFNVIFFNGHWHVPFEAKDTKEKDFHVSSGNVVQKPMMHLFQSLFYTPCEELGARVGVSSMFSEPATGIVENVPVKVSKTFQEAFIKVNEEGATAGAFTGAVWVFLSASSRPPTPMKFTVDHPFMYAILYEDKILFAGTYSG